MDRREHPLHEGCLNAMARVTLQIEIEIPDDFDKDYAPEDGYTEEAFVHDVIGGLMELVENSDMGPVVNFGDYEVQIED